jgi:hypothetical protein
MRFVVADYEEVVDGPAVGYDKALIVPFSTKYVLEKECTAAAWVSVITVVCTHELTYITVFDERLDNGTTDIDSLDAMEYAVEGDAMKLL